LEPLLALDSVYCGYHGEPVVRGLSLQVDEGELACLLGPSGCGKTTALRAIAGFEPLQDGRITLGGEVISAPGHTRAPEARNLGMVFQDHALFPHLTVGANVAFGLARRPARERRARARELLGLVGLAGLEGRYPHELSGGQQQRVALARALAPDPAMILLDEPFSNLDVDLRERVSAEVRDILKSRGITGILVTHDQHEAFALGDRIGVMRDGQLLQWDTAYNLYHRPADRFVADFIGQGVLLPGMVRAPGLVETELGMIQGRRPCDCPPGSRVDLLLRPDDVVPDGDAGLEAEVVGKAFKGAETLYTLRLPTGSAVLSLFPSHQDHRVGERVRVTVVPDHVVAFPLES
jgi:iron(III) transport system ATP-binding protein